MRGWGGKEGHMHLILLYFDLSMVAEHTFILYNNAGEVYRGKLIEAEDNMNSQMASVTVTFRLI